MRAPSLFRPEAIAHATGRLDGAVLLPATRIAWVAIAIVAATLVLAAWFASTATYSRQQSVPGSLSPQGGVARVVAPRSGTVVALLVAEGERVAAGAALASVGSAEGFGTAASRPGNEGVSATDQVVAAPIGGRVEALTAHVGQSVAHGDTVAVIAGDGELIAEMLVPPHVAGLVAIDQTLPLEYDTLAFGHRAAQQGTVIDVSRTALAPDEIGRPGIAVAGPVFRVRVRLPDQRVHTGTESVQLRAGMLVTADIAGHRRTLFESLFEPDTVTP